MIEAQIWMVLALFFGAMFVTALVTSLPRDSRAGTVSRNIMTGALALGLAWYIGKDMMS